MVSLPIFNSSWVHFPIKFENFPTYLLIYSGEAHTHTHTHRKILLRASPKVTNSEQILR